MVVVWKIDFLQKYRYRGNGDTIERRPTCRNCLQLRQCCQLTHSRLHLQLFGFRKHDILNVVSSIE